MDRSKLPCGVAEEPEGVLTFSSSPGRVVAASTTPAASRAYQPTIASARPAPVKPSQIKSPSELASHLSRCALLLRNDALMQKMPTEKAEDLIKRYAGLVWFGCGVRRWLVEEEGEEVSSSASNPIDRAENYVILKGNFAPEIRERVCAAVSAVAQMVGTGSVEAEPADATTSSASVNNGGNTTVSRESYHTQHAPEEVLSYQAALMEAQRYTRIDLHQQLTRSFGDLLSKKEISRLVATSSERLLLTFDETQKMEERFAKMERESLLRRLRQRMAALEQQAIGPIPTRGGGGGSTNDGASSTAYDARDFGDSEDERKEAVEACDGDDPEIVAQDDSDDDDEGGADVGANVVFTSGVRRSKKDGTIEGIEEDDY